MEPTYEYVKGKGWVLQSCGVAYFSFDNKQYMVLDRPPNIGELCIWSSRHNQFYVKGGKPNLKNWAEYLTRNFKACEEYNAEIDKLAGRKVDSPVFVTIVPV